jgi:5-methylcytosine-specific restriction endonuclease McrA
MSTQVMVTLPDEVYASARRLADLMHREVADVLTDALRLAIPALRPVPDLDRPVESLSDTEVLALTELQLPPDQDSRLSELLDRQQAGSLTETERPELATLMQAPRSVSSAVSDALRARVRAHAGDACVYCRSPQRLVLGPLEIDHIVPKARGGTDDEENLCLACRMCNSYKGTQTRADPAPRSWAASLSAITSRCHWGTGTSSGSPMKRAQRAWM